jgi:hypothetical protein
MAEKELVSSNESPFVVAVAVVVDRSSLVQLIEIFVVYSSAFIHDVDLPGENVYVGTFLFRSPPNLNTRLDTLGRTSCSLLPCEDGAMRPGVFCMVIV